MEGISASAVSQRTARDGLDLLVLASINCGPSDERSEPDNEDAPMSAVAVFLIAVGCADIARRLTTRTWAGALIGCWRRSQRRRCAGCGIR